MQINITKMIGYHYHPDFYGDLAFAETGQLFCNPGWFPPHQQLTGFLIEIIFGHHSRHYPEEKKSDYLSRKSIIHHFY